MARLVEPRHARDVAAPGSHLALSHLTAERDADRTARLSSAVARRDRVSLVFRPRAQIAAFFGDFALVPPGLVDVARWPAAERGTERTGAPLILAGVGRKG